MINNEKFSFNSGAFRNKLKKKKIQKEVLSDRSEETSPHSYSEASSKQTSKTPEISIEKIGENSPILMYDFRSVSHKARIISPEKGSNRIFFNQASAKNSEVEEINNVKKKLSRKNLNISIKALEYALSTHSGLQLEIAYPLELPRGGELLTKSPILKTIKKKKKSASPAKGKISKPKKK